MNIRDSLYFSLLLPLQKTKPKKFPSLLMKPYQNKKTGFQDVYSAIQKLTNVTKFVMKNFPSLNVLRFAGHRALCILKLKCDHEWTVDGLKNYIEDWKEVKEECPPFSGQYHDCMKRHYKLKHLCAKCGKTTEFTGFDKTYTAEQEAKMHFEFEQHFAEQNKYPVVGKNFPAQ